MRVISQDEVVEEVTEEEEITIVIMIKIGEEGMVIVIIKEKIILIVKGMEQEVRNKGREIRTLYKIVNTLGSRTQSRLLLTVTL